MVDYCDEDFVSRDREFPRPDHCPLSQTMLTQFRTRRREPCGARGAQDEDATQPTIESGLIAGTASGP